MDLPSTLIFLSHFFSSPVECFRLMCLNRYGGVFSSGFVETARKLRRKMRKEWKEKLGDEHSLLCLDGKYVVARKMYSNSWGSFQSNNGSKQTAGGCFITTWMLIDGFGQFNKLDCRCEHGL